MKKMDGIKAIAINFDKVISEYVCGLAVDMVIIRYFKKKCGTVITFMFYCR